MKGQIMAAKQYGTPITPTLSVEKVIEEIAEHLNWPKGDVIGYAITQVRPSLMEHPRALRFSEDESQGS
jgi:hypothetical protein